MPSEWETAVYAAAESLAKGQVVSFGDIAAAAGRPAASRSVGTILARSSDALPWWRVVYADGHLPPCNPSLQAERLADEGVTLVGFKVTAAPRGRFG